MKDYQNVNLKEDSWDFSQTCRNVDKKIIFKHHSNLKYIIYLIEICIIYFIIDVNVII